MLNLLGCADSDGMSVLNAIKCLLKELPVLIMIESYKCSDNFGVTVAEFAIGGFDDG